MAELINEKDSLNEGRKKLNEAIKDSNKAKLDSADAKTKAEQALTKSESTQEQLNQVVIDGDSSVEAAQARVDENGQSHTTLKERIDDGFTKTNAQLAENAIVLPHPNGIDDTHVIKEALLTGFNILFPKTNKHYKISDELIVEHKGQKIIGNGMDLTVIEAIEENINGIIIKADSVTVTDLQMLNFTYNRNDEGERHSIRTQGSNNTIIERCKTVNSHDAGIRIGHDFNFNDPNLSKPSTNCKVLYCETINTEDGSGIEVLNSENIIIHGNTSIDSAFHGVRVAGSKNCKVTENEIIGFGLGREGFGEGVYMRGGTNRTVGETVNWKCVNNIVSNNRIVGDKVGVGIANECEHIIVSGNLIELNGNESFGFRLTNNINVSDFGYKNVNITGNIVKGDYKYGVNVVEGGDSPQIANNQFIGFRESGIFMDTKHDVTRNMFISNNVFSSDVTTSFCFRNYRKPQKNLIFNGNICNIPDSDLVFRDIHGGCYRGGVIYASVTREHSRLVTSQYSQSPIETGDRVVFYTEETPPTPLENNKEYYAIRNRSDRYELAESLSDAMNSVHIPLTSDGVGNHYIIKQLDDTNAVY